METRFEKRPYTPAYERRQNSVYRMNLAIQEYNLFVDGFIEEKSMLTDEQLDMGLSMTGCEDLDTQEKFKWTEFEPKVPEIDPTFLNYLDELVSPFKKWFIGRYREEFYKRSLDYYFLYTREMMSMYRAKQNIVCALEECKRLCRNEINSHFVQG